MNREQIISTLESKQDKKPYSVFKSRLDSMNEETYNKTLSRLEKRNFNETSFSLYIYKNSKNA